MSYRFVIGSAGAGKSHYLRGEILERAERSMKDPAGDRTHYLYIVPEQYNMQTQADLVRSSGARGIMNIDVLSFGRLAYRVFNATGTQTGTVIDEMGKLLVLRKLAGNVRGDLHVLKNAIHRPGMIEEVKSILSEFMQYGIGPEEVEQLADFAGDSGSGALKARLEDILVIYRAFAAYREGKFITAEETLDLLADRISEADFLRGAVIVFEGFTDYTPVQYRVIRELLHCAGEVIFSITGPAEEGREAWEAAAAGRIGSEQDLFYLSRKTVRDLTALAQSVGAAHGEDVCLEGGERFRNTPALACLERQIFRHPVLQAAVPAAPALACLAAADPEEEARAICMRIQNLVLEEGYTYRDIAVVTGDLDTYGPLFEKIALRSKIPFYLDRTVMILQNPLTTGLKNALSIVAESFSYESVFGYLRSGLSRLTFEETDILENYCLEHGIEGRRKWATPFDEKCEPLRVRLLEELAPLTGMTEGIREAAAYKNAPRTAGRRTEETYAFLEGLDAGGRMRELADAFAAEGDLVQERICRQLYTSLLILLEQIWGLLGDETISAAEYRDLIETACGAVRLGTLPGKADRVLVGDIRRTRLPEVRVLFIAGVNDGIIPEAVTGGGLLSDMDRELLRQSSLELAPAPRLRMFTQRFHLYQNMTKATDRLVLSYAASGTDGKSLFPSYLIGSIKDIFPSLEVEPAIPRAQEERLSSVRDGMPGIGHMLHAYADEQGDDREALTFYRVFWEKGSGEDRADLARLRDAAFRRYTPVSIGKQAAAALYGDTLAGSVTMLEQAAQCMLRHFLQYGLRLKERRQYVFRPVDAGTVLHGGLERFAGKLRSRGLSWADLTEEERLEIAREALNEEASLYHDLILYATHRSRHRLEDLQRILDRSVEELQFQLRQGSFAPWAYEMVFGEGSRGGRLSYDLSEGRHLRLRGKIDRIDLCRKPEGIYVKILDYKSGSRNLDPAEMAAGRQLQLILYMNAVLRLLEGETEGEVSPSAMLYYRMTDPVMRLSGGEQEDQEARERSRRRLLRPTGMVRSDGPDTELLDKSQDKDSLVIPVSRKKDGTFTAASGTYTLEEFRELTEIVDRQICLLAEAVLDGDAAAEPLKNKNDTACTYCPYREVCGFDLKTPGYHYRT